jgi:dienelactone hydrolase
MLLRRILPVALAAVFVVGCEPSVPTESQPTASNPQVLDYLLFNPATGQIPLPNDLGLQPSAIATQQGAQQELLSLFASQGGYPNDQEVPVTIDFQRNTLTSDQNTASAPPANLDLTTLTAASFLFLELKQGATAPVPVPASSVEISYANSGNKGTLTIRNKPNATTKSRAWNPGSTYIVLVRGGPSGVKFVGGGQTTAQATIYFLVQGLTSPGTGQVTEKQGASLALEQNQYLLPVPAGWTGGTREGKAVTGTTLESLRLVYLQKGLFGLADRFWGAGSVYDLASLQTFTIAPSGANQPQVVMDPSAGVVPLPSDLLLDPANGGKTVVNNPAFGPLASGIATLDGFTTTAMLLAQTSSPVVMQSVTKDTVFLYEVPASGAPVRVKELTEGGAGAGFVAEPLAIGKTATGGACTTAAGCFSTAIGLQPAAIVSAAPVITLPPLKEATEYAVLVTSGVVTVPPTTASTTPLPLKRSTLASILLFNNPLYDAATGQATLSGQSPQQSALLEQIRVNVAKAVAQLNTDKGIPKSNVVLGYTFRTQSISSTSLQLAAAPYQPALAPAMVPGTPTDVTGVMFPTAVPPSVSKVFSVPVTTIDPIDKTTGALNPNTAAWAPTQLGAYVVVPTSSNTSIAACPAPASALKCAPLVVFHHGLGGNKGHVAAIAGSLAAAGFVVAAIDAPLHGDRAYCTSNAECTGGTPTCNFFGPVGTQGESVQIGTCGNGSKPVSSVSGRFFVGVNFFRWRDASRQDILDSSALVLNLAPPTTAQNAFFNALAQQGIAVDGRKVYWIGQSLGGILGTLNLASNPRLSRGVLNVPGATWVDIASTSPTFIPQLQAALAGLTPPIAVGSPEYLQFLQVAKWVLDPADPINFAGHITGDANHPTWPNLLTNQPNQPAKNVFGQWAECDATIPNPTNLFLLDQIGLTPTPTSSPNAYTMYRVAGAGTTGACTAVGSNPAHGFLLSPVDPTATANGQADAAAYLSTLATPASAAR